MRQTGGRRSADRQWLAPVGWHASCSGYHAGVGLVLYRRPAASPEPSRGRSLGLARPLDQAMGRRPWSVMCLLTCGAGLRRNSGRNLPHKTRCSHCAPKKHGEKKKTHAHMATSWAREKSRQRTKHMAAPGRAAKQQQKPRSLNIFQAPVRQRAELRRNEGGRPNRHAERKKALFGTSQRPRTNKNGIRTGGTPSGSCPVAFQTLVLPALRRMRTCCHNASESIASAWVTCG